MTLCSNNKEKEFLHSNRLPIRLFVGFLDEGFGFPSSFFSSYMRKACRLGVERLEPSAFSFSRAIQLNEKAHSAHQGPLSQQRLLRSQRANQANGLIADILSSVILRAPPIGLKTPNLLLI